MVQSTHADFSGSRLPQCTFLLLFQRLSLLLSTQFGDSLLFCFLFGCPFALLSLAREV